MIGGTFPERDGPSLYNTCTCYDREGKLVAVHRKVHLFDMHIPGKVSFRESDVLSAGDSATVFDTGAWRGAACDVYPFFTRLTAIISATPQAHFLTWIAHARRVLQNRDRHLYGPALPGLCRAACRHARYVRSSTADTLDRHCLGGPASGQAPGELSSEMQGRNGSVKISVMAHEV